jgi:uroporphyrinogen-III synthase
VSETVIDFEKTLVMREALPLYLKRVLFTTPRNYAATLSRLLVLRGALPVWMPTVVIEPMQRYREFDQAIRNLSDYSWLAFTSRNGIDAFFDRLEALELDAGVLHNTKVCALGKDAEALRKRGLQVDLVPPVATTKGLVDELARRGNKNGRLLLPVPEVVGMDEPRVIPDLVAWLSGIGMEVHRVPAYTTTRVSEGFSAEKKMLMEGAIDVVAFTSAAEIESLLFLLGKERDVLQSTTIACYGPVTAGGATERGVHPEIVSKDFSALEGFVEALELYYLAE